MTSFDDEKRNDAAVQDAVKAQFSGIVPERESELASLWTTCDLQFSLLADGRRVEIQGGLYRHVQFNHRALRVMWISAFAAWEAYRANSVAALEGRMIQTGRLEALLDCALSVRDSANPLGKR